MELALILLPKVRNIFLSFPVSEANGQNSHRGSVVHANAKKGSNILCSLLLKSLKTVLHSWFLKMFPSRPTSRVNNFLFLQGLDKDLINSRLKIKVADKMSVFKNIKSHFLPGADLPPSFV